MKLTVLGNTGPYPKAGGACSGYLLENGDAKVVLDMGNGTLANLRTICDIEDITAVICSHLHPDHVSDLFVLRYALEMRGMTIPLYAPDSPDKEFDRLAYKNVFDIMPITEDLRLEIGGMTSALWKCAIRLKILRSRLMMGDLLLCILAIRLCVQALEEFTKGVDVLLCDSAFWMMRILRFILSMEKAIQNANSARSPPAYPHTFSPEISPQRYY